MPDQRSQDDPLNAKKERVTLRVQQPLARDVEALVRMGYFPNVSEAWRFAGTLLREHYDHVLGPETRHLNDRVERLEALCREEGIETDN